MKRLPQIRFSDALATLRGVGGVYLIYDRDEILLYVGMSENIGKRLLAHCGHGDGLWAYILKARGAVACAFQNRKEWLAVQQEIIGTYTVSVYPVAMGRAGFVEVFLHAVLKPQYGWV